MLLVTTVMQFSLANSEETYSYKHSNAFVNTVTITCSKRVRHTQEL